MGYIRFSPSSSTPRNRRCVCYQRILSSFSGASAIVFGVDSPVDVESPWVGLALRLLAVPVLVVINGLFVAAEFALVSVRKTQVEELVQQGDLT